MGGERLTPLAPDAAKLVGAEVGIPDMMSELSVFRILLHNPKVAGALNGMLKSLLWQGSLDARLRELVIMRLGWATGSVYEWTQHWRVATQLGVDEADLLAVRDWRSSSRFGPTERAVLGATDEMMETGTLSDAAWSACVDALREPALLVELVVAIGNWKLFSGLLRSLEVPLEDGVAPWPPDGVAPA
ncbi:MAG: carboxymuconolactone decarboxylase family protein [Acidimicrobiales bacterium]